VSPAILLSMKSNPKAQKEYLLDLFRLNQKTLDAASELHKAEFLVVKGSENQSKYWLMSRIGQFIGVLLISYSQLPSVDFRPDDEDDDSRRKTREYLTNFFPYFNDDKLGKPRLYSKDADKSDSRYLSKKEVKGIFGEIMNYEGSPDEIIGAIDTTLTSSGKNGIVFLEDGLIIKDIMSKPIRIAYKDIETVVGTTILSHNHQGDIVETDFKLDTSDVDEKKLELSLENIKPYWAN